MRPDLFEYLSYRDYLLAWIGSQPKQGRGARAALAHAMACPLSRVSEVLKGSADFTLEQAEEANEFLGHTPEQSEFFLNLVQLSRAGTPRLKRRVESQIQKQLERRLVLKNRLTVKAELTREDQALFYSSWEYAAIHILLTIERFQTGDAIAKRLGISLKKTAGILEYLTRIGLAKIQQGRFVVGESRVHLGNDSPMISKHHINWRLQAMRSLENDEEGEALHYSSVVSIANSDVVQIKSILVKAIEKTKALIRDSPEEDLHSFCLDFFKVT